MSLRSVATILVLSCIITSVFGAPAAHAQSPLISAPTIDDVPQAVELPEDLTTEQIDGLLARLTDADIRRLLAEELRSRAEATASDEMATMDFVDFAAMRLDEMQAEIGERLPRWFKAIASLSDRRDEVAKRIGTAEHGPLGMVLAAALVVIIGAGAGALTGRMTQPWRIWLQTPQRGLYWDKVIRTLALGIVEVLPIFAFVTVSNPAISLLSGELGPLDRLQWIYTAGISYSWGGLVVARRLFAPKAPQIRIAPLPDDMARRVYRVIRLSAIIGAGSWVMGGTWLHLGFGFPPALLTVASGGTAVAGVLLYAVSVNFADIRKATEAVFGQDNAGAFARISVASAPWLLAVYVVGAYLFWVAHWVEQGQHHLLGPVGTLIVYLTLPIFDRLGREIIRSILRSPSDLAERFRGVFYRAWRVVIGLSALLTVLAFWGVHLVVFAYGDVAPLWMRTIADVAVTLLITWFVWELVKAALHSDRKFVAAGEDVDPALAPQATRLDTLTPLFRNVLLAFVATIGFMFILSSAGVDIGPLLASAGIIGIAVGFGAQALVRDIFSGMFFLIDDAFRVGEYIELTEELRGDVESISIRSLQLRHHRGPVITIPFGEMKHIINHTRDWILYKMQFRMNPDTDPQKFRKMVKKIGFEFMEHPDHGHKFFEPLKSQGVYYVDDDSALVFRVKFKCKPRAQFVLRREIYHRLRQAFEENGFKLARRKVEVVSNDPENAGDANRGGLPDDVIDSVA